MPSSCEVWREDLGLLSRPCRKRWPSSRDDGGILWVFSSCGASAPSLLSFSPALGMYICMYICISSVQPLSRVQLFATPWTAAHQPSLFITNSWSLLKLMPVEPVMPSNHLILCPPLLLPSSMFPSIRVFSNESVLRIRWPKYWSFSFSIIPSKEIPGLISFRMDWLDLPAAQGTLQSLLQHHSCMHGC